MKKCVDSTRLVDHEYVRNGVAEIFMEVEPLARRRHVAVTGRRTRVDWAHFIQKSAWSWTISTLTVWLRSRRLTRRLEIWWSDASKRAENFVFMGNT